MKNKLKQIVTKEMFNPKLLGLFTNPFYITRKALYKGIYANRAYFRGRLLDFGCGQKPYKDLFDVQEYIGMDIEVSGHDHNNEQIDVYYDGKTIPFANNYFDSVFSSEVFEHVFNLKEILDEIFRVLKPDGSLFVTLPFVWDEHEAPYDFARYTSFGTERLLKESGFKIIKIEKSTNYVETVFQLWNAYLYQFVFPRNTFLKAIMTTVFIAPITILGIILSKILPINKSFYHDNIVVAKK